MWSAPIESRFGWHLVKIIVHDPGAPLSFDEAFARVRLEYAIERRHETLARFLDQAFKRYDVEIDGARIRDYHPTQRLALRSGPSKED